MSKKEDMFYFETLCKSADCSYKAAVFLEQVVENYSVENIKDDLDKMHVIENEGDNYNHEIMEKLTKAFITPIEREDILTLSNSIDDVTDAIEDSLLYMYMLNVQHIRKEAVLFANLIVDSTKALKRAFSELANFKKSKSIRDELIEINRIEEEGDKLFISSMRELTTDTTADPVHIIRWKDILDKFEECLDITELTAKEIDEVVMKNS
ncbi:MAG: DUF47 family protein [Lachnospiraceae bacterium]|jgi:uncharacterized protein Yka (UPF0111/DUF47 family)|nr:DUF47 family protein [Lachnospiraceae bacterium]